MPKLTIDDFAGIFGSSIDSFDDECKEYISARNFNYSIITGKERDDTILYVLKKIEDADFSKKGKDKWESGWANNLSMFENSGNIKDLIPIYSRPHILRLKKEYIRPVHKDFILDFFEIIRLWIFKNFVKCISNIYEIGCGSGHNLPILSRLYPLSKIIGLDWSSSSIKIVNLLSTNYPNISGKEFDAFTPDAAGVNIPENSCIVTIGCFEQLGYNYESIVNFICNSKSICVQLEPLDELYDQSNIIDYLAYKFHRLRGYLNGYWSYLLKMQNEGRIEILKLHRMQFGDIFHDGWTIIVWKGK